MAGDLKRILYVEDEADIQTIAVTVLESIGGFAVIACSSGMQALQAAPGANADLILLDVMMPQMDGPATLKALRQILQTAATPVVFMTAKVQASEIAHFRSLGALDVIPKPFDPMTLSDQINEIWRRRPEASGQAGPLPHSLSAQPPEDELQALFKRYAADLPASIAKIGALWEQLAAGSDPTALESLHRALHSLAGSGETFGYVQLGETAKAVELALEPYLKNSAVPAAMLEPLTSMLERLKQAADIPDSRA
jgi:two-component system OmpR family response regulator